MDRYVVVGQHDWCFDIYKRTLSKCKGYWYYLGSNDDLAEKIREVNPRYVFFLHWSYFVPKEITDEYE